MKHLISTAAALLIFSSLSASEYKVAFETMSCMGESGFAVIGVDSIHKIENGDCSSPDNPNQKLKRLLVKDGSGSFAIYSLTYDEAKSVMSDVKSYMRAKQQALQNSNTVIIEH